MRRAGGRRWWQADQGDHHMTRMMKALKRVLLGLARLVAPVGVTRETGVGLGQRRANAAVVGRTDAVARRVRVPTACCVRVDRVVVLVRRRHRVHRIKVLGRLVDRRVGKVIFLALAALEEDELAHRDNNREERREAASNRHEDLPERHAVARGRPRVVAEALAHVVAVNVAAVGVAFDGRNLCDTTRAASLGRRAIGFGRRRLGRRRRVAALARAGRDRDRQLRREGRAVARIRVGERAPAAEERLAGRVRTKEVVARSILLDRRQHHRELRVRRRLGALGDIDLGDLGDARPCDLLPRALLLRRREGRRGNRELRIAEAAPGRLLVALGKHGGVVAGGPEFGEADVAAHLGVHACSE
ncbi:hypothetical protein SPRG_19335 [Saprolegnia parasitica CBS 223.65]|uniref:Uncharacterized protein n=1 Tax=Saprolegnia parasitica (strain CBS 223.65) TaxID=695850 RepID=A0A067D4W4_SAPPC|nr:hypothetical protein SPRG_19335 [Saprolegnia parasitica CBS 223.65]KDO33726.1 hypothetical protein SPRG_19335 [Saprolegnia parasitica CBS 223.65]|eukprot:XP_012195746.1 hypothetical protein SPRG_19335 [Saprolegnia parasitica CBS 223.65]